MAKIAVLLFLAAVVLYILAGIAVYTFQRSLLYFASRTDVSPASVDLADAEVRNLKTSDGETLVAWFVRCPGPNLAIYFHGNADPLAPRAERIRQLADLGFSVLAVDYRGFGASTGTPTEAGLHLDADATYDDALKLGFDPGHIILLGESLGSGVALEIASRRQVAGIILDSPYSSVVDVAVGRFWLFPVRLLMKDQFRSDIWIPKIHVPILILHGTNDLTIPIQYGRRLASLGGSNVTFFEVPGAEHVVFDEDAADGPIRDWLKKFGM